MASNASMAANRRFGGLPAHTSRNIVQTSRQQPTRTSQSLKGRPPRRRSVPNFAGMRLPEDLSNEPMPFPMEAAPVAPRINKYGPHAQTFQGVVGSAPRRLSSRGTTLKQPKPAVGRRLNKAMSQVSIKPNQRVFSPRGGGSDKKQPQLTAKERHDQWITEQIHQQKSTTRADRSYSSTDMLMAVDHMREPPEPQQQYSNELEMVQDGEEFLDHDPTTQPGYVPHYYAYEAPPSRPAEPYQSKAPPAPFAVDYGTNKKVASERLLWHNGQPISRRAPVASRHNQRRELPYRPNIHDKPGYWKGTK